MKRLMVLIYMLFTVAHAQDVKILSLSLEQAHEIAFQNNPYYQIQLKRIEVRKGIYWSEMMPDNPEIGIEIEQVRNGAMYSAYGERRIFITQKLDFPTNYLFRHLLLKADIRKEIIQLDATKRNVTFLLKDAYWKLVLLQELVKHAQRNMELSEDFYRRAVTSYELGETDRLTMLKAKMHFGTSQTKLNATQKNEDISRSHLKEILGIDKPVQIILTDTLTTRIPEFSRIELTKRLSQHPDYQTAYIEKQSSVNARWLAYGSFLPSLSVSYFTQEIDETDFWGGEIALSVPFWLPGKAGLINQKRAEQAMAEYNMKALKLKLKKEIEQAAAHFEKAIEEAKLYQTDILKEAEEVFRIARRSYAIGEIGYLDYIDAYQMLIQTQENYLTALYEFQVKKANLEQLTGTVK
jgi:cobalt-zinc-cadmium resistance protein CzcA